MMYWGFPEVSQDEWFEKAAPIEPGAIHVPPEIAYQKLGWAGGPESLEISVLDGRPLYRFRVASERGIVFADTGDVLRVTPEFAQRVAARWTGQAAGKARFKGLLNEPDQWTVSGESGALRPLFQFSWPDGEQAYVSGETGDVVQHTTSQTRLAAYFGAIPHWLYWTPLRKNGRAWYRAVVWSSSALVLLGFLGMLVGAWMFSPGRRYRRQGMPSSVPYSGQKRWHMILGLLFGLLSCTWAFSGLLSLEPFGWLSGNQEAASTVDAALGGGSLPFEAFAKKSPAAALEQAGVTAKRVEFVSFNGRPYYLIRKSPQTSRIVPVQGAVTDQFDRDEILKVVSEEVQPETVEEARVVGQYDAYYLDRHAQHPLPALLVRLNDESQSVFYIDLKTARVVEAYDRRSRWNRWLYHGLHSWNLPWLYSHRPAWDLLMIVLLVGGLALGVTGSVLAVQLIARTLGPAGR